ncbi:MAG: helix-turn-helix transcriptional regulator [Acutalibacteraceae bacterium]
MAATIKDVARLAGVSPSTVSRVLNQKGVISDETKQKIASAMEQLKYVPNDIARSFANRLGARDLAGHRYLGRHGLRQQFLQQHRLRHRDCRAPERL